MSLTALFTPLTINKLTLANRIVMAPMTRAFSPGGVPGPDVAAYYRRRAEHGVGLIVTEGTVVGHPASSSNAAVPRFHGEDALAGWARVVTAVHEVGGRIMPQLWHVGTMRKPGDGPNPEVPPIGPSGLARPGEPVLAPMTEAEIAGVIEAYAQSAASAARLGFDGIELHGAHGYLIDQFFWEATNRRTDRYGGSLEARARFGVEVVAACRRAVGPDYPIVLRFSQWKIQDYTARLVTSPAELERFVAPFTAAGVDVFHCSTRRFWQPEFEGSDLNLAGWVKKLTGRATITVGSIGLDSDFMADAGRVADRSQLERLDRMIVDGEVDLVAVGRALLADPAWAAKVREGRTSELVPYARDAVKTLV